MKAAIGILGSGFLFLGPIVATALGDCPGGELRYYHDDTFESGYNWWNYPEVHDEPYFGAFGEAYDLGSGEICCGAFWVTQAGVMPYGNIDVYVWDGGTTRDPGEVLAVVFGAHLYNIPYWPDVGRNDMEIWVEVSDEFTIGYWVVDCWDDVWTAADHDDPGGHPWTCIAPGLEWPSGWQHPGIVWEEIRSLGIGVWFETDPTSVESVTWGEVKALFH